MGGTGFYAKGEYVLALKKWFGLRPYAGFIYTSPCKTNTVPNLYEFEVTSKAFLFGGKARVCAPIPYISPYFEFGLGASLGAFETYTPSNDKKENGLLVHIPFEFGLALGKNNGVEIAFT